MVWTWMLWSTYALATRSFIVGAWVLWSTYARVWNTGVHSYDPGMKLSSTYVLGIRTLCGLA